MQLEFQSLAIKFVKQPDKHYPKVLILGRTMAPLVSGVNAQDVVFVDNKRLLVHTKSILYISFSSGI